MITDFKNPLEELINNEDLSLEDVVNHQCFFQSLQNHEKFLLEFLNLPKNLSQLVENLVNLKSGIYLKILRIPKCPIFPFILKSNLLVDSLFKDLNNISNFPQKITISQFFYSSIYDFPDLFIPYIPKYIDTLLKNIELDPIYQLLTELLQIDSINSIWIVWVSHLLLTHNLIIPNYFHSKRSLITNTYNKLESNQFSETFCTNVLRLEEFSLNNNFLPKEIFNDFANDLLSLFNKCTNVTQKLLIFKISTHLFTDQNLTNSFIEILRNTKNFGELEVNIFKKFAIHPKEEIIEVIPLLVDYFFNDNTNSFFCNVFCLFVENCMRNNKNNNKVKDLLIKLLPLKIINKIEEKNWFNTVYIECFVMKVAESIDPFVDSEQWKTFRKNVLSNWNMKKISKKREASKFVYDFEDDLFEDNIEEEEKVEKEHVKEENKKLFDFVSGININAFHTDEMNDVFDF